MPASLSPQDIAPADVPFVLPLGSDAADLPTAGGKGAALARLVQADLPVPDGFHVTTRAYDHVLDVHDLRGRIFDALENLNVEATAGLEATSNAISSRLKSAQTPSEIEQAIREAYAALPGESPAVAVRSSATAEDLPELSFAGQQETFLNVQGEAALLDAVQRCWASLWTPRAIAYRERAGIEQGAVSMGVTVQIMVQADVSGVLFTANPASGARDEFLINASYGLGESIVSGQVTPDTYVLRSPDFELTDLTLGTKAMRIDSSAEQGIVSQEVSADLQSARVLDDAQLRDLAKLAVDAEAVFESDALDIEWAMTDGRLALLQARPITGLPDAVPDEVVWEPPTPGSNWLRRQVVEHMPEPLSPLFDELYVERGLEYSIDTLFEIMGRPKTFLDGIMGRPFFHTVNGFAYMRADFNLGPRAIGKVLWFYITVIPGFMRKAVPFWREEGLPTYLETIESWDLPDLDSVEDERLIQGVEKLAEADAVYWFAANFPLAFSKITDGLLDRFLGWVKPRAASESDDARTPISSGALLRGYPSKTLDTQVDLEAVARLISGDAALCERVLKARAADMVSILEEDAAGRPGSGGARALPRRLRSPNLQPRLRRAHTVRRPLAGPFWPAWLGGSPRTESSRSAGKVC